MIVNNFFSKKSSFLFCIEDLKKQVDSVFDTYDFLIFSIHPSYSTHDITSIIKKIFRTDNFIGIHTTNVFIDDEIKQKGVGVLVIQFEKRASLEYFCIQNHSPKYVDRLANYLNSHKKDLNLIITAKDDVCDLVKKISNRLNYSPINNIAGGVIPGMHIDGEYRDMIFTKDGVFNNAIIVLTFKNVLWHIGVSSGFIPYGITYKIAKSTKRKIYTVDDGKNFAYIFKKLLEDIKDPDIKYTWYTPIYVMNKKNGYISSVRTIKNITDKYVEFYADIEEGEYFKLSFATKEDLFKEDEKIAYKMWNHLKNIDVVFHFSCLARQYVLENEQEKEIKIYTNIFNAHLFGFFTAGEIAPDLKHQKLLFYNETSIPVIVKEKI